MREEQISVEMRKVVVSVFRYIFLCLLEMSLEFEVHNLSRLEICFTVVNVYIIGEAIEVDEITSENKNRRKCGI